MRKVRIMPLAGHVHDIAFEVYGCSKNFFLFLLFFNQYQNQLKYSLIPSKFYHLFLF